MIKEYNMYNEFLMEETPIYKAVNDGVNSLTNVELISLLIGKASTRSSVEQARKILAISDGSLNNLATKRIEEIEVVQGVGDNKAAAVLVAMELGKRYYMEEQRMTELKSSDLIYNYMRPLIMGLQHEEAFVLFLKSNFRLVKRKRISSGGLTETAVDVRMIMREAVLCGATVIVLCHNHPSGNKRPSVSDDKLTQSLKKACETMRIVMADHLVLTEGGYYSYNDEGRI